MSALERPANALMIDVSRIFEGLGAVTLRAGDPLKDSSRVWVFMTALTSADVDGAKRLEFTRWGTLDMAL